MDALSLSMQLKHFAILNTRNQEREKLAAWMITNYFTTGHGDTIEDLLKELEWQVKELRGRLDSGMSSH